MSAWIKTYSLADLTDQTQIVAKIECDTVSDLPAVNAFAGRILNKGSEAHVIDGNTVYELNSAGSWIRQDEAGRFDVYTKTETDTKISDAIRDASAAQALIDADQDTEIAKQLAALLWYIDFGASKNLMPTESGSNPPGQEWFRQNLVLPPGDYVVFFRNYSTTDTDSTQCRIGFFDDNGSAVAGYKYIDVGSDHSVTNAYVISTLTASCTNVRFYPSQTVLLSSGDTLTFSGCMICPKALWDISDAYAPYAKTNRDLSV